ncbi:MAG: hypothetical protein ACHQF2_08245, partial [Flavobacteriales bacterium]
MGGNQTRASQIVNEIEIPYFNDVVPMGWHPSLKAALALKELLPPFERGPMITIEGNQLDELKNILKKNKWL